MPSKLPIYDRRMIELMQYCIASHKYKCDSVTAFLLSIDYNQVNNIKKIQEGTGSFRIKYIHNAIKKYKISPAFFFDELAPMFQKEKRSPIDNLKDSVRVIEQLLKK